MAMIVLSIAHYFQYPPMRMQLQNQLKHVEDQYYLVVKILYPLNLLSRHLLFAQQMEP
jgi:hypothetical protein